MKRSIFGILAIASSLTFFSCKTDEPKKEAEISVETKQGEAVNIILLQPGQSQTGKIYGGNGTYTIESQNPGVAQVTFDASTNEITAKALHLGDCDVSIRSGAKSMGLLVRVAIEIDVRNASGSIKSTELGVGKTQTLSLHGGNLTFAINRIADPKIVEAKIENNSLTLRGLAQGQTEIRITSGGKTFILPVKIVA